MMDSRLFIELALTLGDIWYRFGAFIRTAVVLTAYVFYVFLWSKTLRMIRCCVDQLPDVRATEEQCTVGKTQVGSLSQLFVEGNIDTDNENEINVVVPTQQSAESGDVLNERDVENVPKINAQRRDGNIDVDTETDAMISTQQSGTETYINVVTPTQQSAECGDVLNEKDSENVYKTNQDRMEDNIDIGTENDKTVVIPTQQSIDRGDVLSERDEENLYVDILNDKEIESILNLNQQHMDGKINVDNEIDENVVKPIGQCIVGDTNIDNMLSLNQIRMEDNVFDNTSEAQERDNECLDNVCNYLLTANHDKSSVSDQVAGRGCIYVSDYAVEGDQVDDGMEKEPPMGRTTDTDATFISYEKHKYADLKCEMESTYIDPNTTTNASSRVDTNSRNRTNAHTKTSRKKASIGTDSIFGSSYNTKKFGHAYITHNNDYAKQSDPRKKREHRIKVLSSGKMKIIRRFDCKCLLFNIAETGKNEKPIKYDRLSQLRRYLPNMNTDIGVYMLDRVDRERESNQPIHQQVNMQREWCRFVSFNAYEGRGHTIKLSRNGFFHNADHSVTSTICFFCGMGRDDWEPGDTVEDIHPDCSLYSGISNNIPIHDADNQIQASINGGYLINQTVTERDSVLYTASASREPMGLSLTQPIDGAFTMDNTLQRVVESTPNQGASNRSLNCHVVDGTTLQGDCQGSQELASDDRACVRSCHRQQDGHLRCEDEQQVGVNDNRQEDTERQFNANVADPMQGPVIDLLNYTIELHTPPRGTLPQPELVSHQHVNRQTDQQGSQQAGSYNRSCIICGEGTAMIQPCGHFGCCKRCRLVCPHCMNSSLLL